jgi:hypothetical protein
MFAKRPALSSNKNNISVMKTENELCASTFSVVNISYLFCLVNSSRSMRAALDS